MEREFKEIHGTNVIPQRNECEQTFVVHGQVRGPCDELQGLEGDNGVSRYSEKIRVAAL